MDAPLPPQYVLLLYVVIPCWIVAGFLDWLLHRRSNISTTSGPLESVFHLLLLIEVGLPLTILLLCEVTAVTLLLLLFGSVLHSVTVLCDTTYASSKRLITPLEQSVHAYLEVLPYTALLLLASAHWPIVKEIGEAVQREVRQEYWGLRWRNPPLSSAYLVGLFTSAATFAVLPYIEELFRGLHAQRRLTQLARRQHQEAP
jgi:hypothetical protein